MQHHPAYNISLSISFKTAVYCVLRLRVTHLYAKRRNILPLLGSLILHKIVINWNRSSDVLLGLHVIGTKEQPA